VNRSSLTADPWRLFFPLGIGLAWLGVSHWLWLWLGWSDDAGSAFHAIAQIDGFLWCFVTGFLFTMLPRRTESAPPSRLEMAVGAAAPVLSVAFAKAGGFAVSQTFWLIGCLALLRFVGKRLGTGARRAPVAMIWVSIALWLGVFGAIATAVGGAVDGLYEGHRLGKLLVTQGMVIGLVLGAGSVILPLVTRGERTPDADDDAFPELLAHGFAALFLVATFVVEVFVDASSGYALRAALIALLLVGVARVHRPVTLPGAHRRLVVAACWSIPIGYVLAAVVPSRPQLGLHVVFLGGLAPLALAVGLHAALAHAASPPEVRRGRLSASGFGSWLPTGLIATAVAFRALAELDPSRWLRWLGLASLCFLAATVALGIRLTAARPVRGGVAREGCA